MYPPLQFIIYNVYWIICVKIYNLVLDDNVLELGAQWVHGEEKNVVYELASPHNLLHHDLFPEKVFVNAKGDVIPSNESAPVMELYHKISDDIESRTDVIPPHTSYGEYFVTK